MRFKASPRLPSKILRRGVAMTAATAIIATGLATGGALAASAAPGSSGQKQLDFSAGSYIVTLVEDAAATYEGGINGFAPTSPDAGEQLDASRTAVQSYTDYLAGKQNEVAAQAGVTIDSSYTLALNGFAADLTAAQAASLARNKNVAAVQPDEMMHVTAESSTDFLGLSGPQGVWAQTGGVETAGEGVVLGVLDTGFAPENPAFAGDELGTTAGAAPYYSAPGVTSFDKNDGTTFTGICETGVQFTLDDCSTKVIGARYFVAGFGGANLGTPETGEYLSPRDGAGHGSHTASTAAGNYGVDPNIEGVPFDAISGVAPAAKIAVYKVCWDGPDTTITDDDGCATRDILDGIDAAVADGVDALNFSIGGGAATTTVSPSDQAFFGAAAAGIFVAASAGNSGPDASTLDNASPWITTVGASTIPSYEATAVLGNGEEYAGASVTVDRTPGAELLEGPLVNAAAVALDGAEQANLCVTDSLDPALTEGTIVVCERGVNDRVAKSAEVKRAGGIGMILVNVTPNTTDLDTHTVPTVHLDAQYHDAVMAYAATEGATVSFSPENLTDVVVPTPQIAGFSSRGPVLADGSDLIKPDIAAPGVAILASTANAAGAEPTWAFYSGTSMAAPHIAGLAVLYLGENPLASPSEIKSAMMTTAGNLVDENGDPVTDPFTQGSGNVDPTKYFNPGLVYLNGPADWVSYISGAGYPELVDPSVVPIDPSDLNLASIGIGSLVGSQTITRTVTATEPGTFTASIDVPGVTAVVEPSTLTFAAAGESATYSVTFTTADAPFNEFATGALDWTNGTTVVHSPVAVQPVVIGAVDEAEGTGVTGFTEIAVTPGSTEAVSLTTSGLTAGELQADPNDADSPHSGTGVTGDYFEYLVEVPEGTTYARFDLDAIDDTTDLDLTVYELDATGVPVAGYQSATGSADERVNIEAPAAATYQVFVDLYSVPEASSFDMTVFSVLPDGEPLTLSPASIVGQAGVETSYTASWTGLAPYTSYLGQIAYGDTGVATTLQVVTGEPAATAPVNTAPPVISGTASVGKTLTASTGTWDTEGLTFTYQWLADGAAIAGATASTYRVVAADQGAAIAVAVTATAATGLSAVATSAAVTVKYSSTTTLSLNKRIMLGSSVTATAKVATASDSAPEGVVKFTVNGRAVGAVPVTAADEGTVKYTLPKLPRGLYGVQATFVPQGDTVLGSASRTKLLLVIF